MKISKRQLRRIITEEYSRLARHGLIKEANEFYVSASDPIVMEIIDIAKDAVQRGKPGITYQDIEYAFYEAAEPDEFVHPVSYEDIDFVTSMNEMDIESFLNHLVGMGVLRLVSRPGSRVSMYAAAV